MFKKKINKCSDNNDNYKYSPSVTVPFKVSFEDENPQKMEKIKKEIKKQKKEDHTNPQNIFSLLEKNYEINSKKLNSRKLKPCIKREEDINSSDLAVQLGRDTIAVNIERGLPIKDAETGEDIRPQFFTTNREIANIVYQSDTLSRLDPMSRYFFTRMLRNGNNL